MYHRLLVHHKMARGKGKKCKNLNKLFTDAWAYGRPVAYYGLIPFVLYVGMQGDAVPSWRDLPRYLVAIL